jgi:death-on-curing protein
VAVRYLTIEEVLLLHHTEVGPSGGLRDARLLESAIARPAHTAFGRDVHTTIAAKAAALLQSLVMNHPFVDGNKRTGVLAAFVFADLNGRPVATDDDVVVSTVLELIAGEIDLAALTARFERWTGS